MDKPILLRLSEYTERRSGLGGSFGEFDIPLLICTQFSRGVFHDGLDSSMGLHIFISFRSALCWRHA